MANQLIGQSANSKKVNTIDLAILIIVLIGVIRGFIKGFIYELAVLGSIVVCYFLGFKLAVIVAKLLGKIISVTPGTLHFVSLLIAWIGISVVIFFIARLFEGLVKVAALGLFNKIAGAIFGGMKYIILLSLFLYFFNRINFNTSWLNADTKAESVFYFPLLKISNSIFSSLRN